MLNRLNKQSKILIVDKKNKDGYEKQQNGQSQNAVLAAGRTHPFQQNNRLGRLAWPEPTVQLHPQGIPQLLLAH